MLRLGSLLLLTSLLSSAEIVQANPIIERISFAPRADGEGFVVRVHGSEPLAAYSEPRFIAAHQLELILFNTNLAENCQRDQPSGPVQAYTIETRKGHLYLKFQLDARLKVDARAYRDRETNDLLLGLSVRGDLAAAMPVPARPVASGPTSQAPRISSPTLLDDVRQRWIIDTIVIDAGHGGHDTGAVGAGGLREKDVVLPIALKVGAYLEQQLGVNVVYTRQDDRFITLRNRGKIANAAGGKLFISIHANASTNRSAYGTETYFLGLDKSDAARTVMERENSVIKLESNPSVYEAYNEQALILQTLTQSAYLKKAEQLAGLIESQFAERVGRKSRGVKQARFYVLWSASMPSILVETGFVTNPTEAQFLESETGQDYLASAIFRAVRDFKAQYEQGLNYNVGD